MKYQCLNNIGIIEKFLFYHKTEYDYDAVAGKKAHSSSFTETEIAEKF